MLLSIVCVYVGEDVSPSLCDVVVALIVCVCGGEDVS